MACTYTHQGQTFTAWEFVDYLAAMPVEELMKYLPEKARAQLVMASGKSSVRFYEDIPNEDWLVSKREYAMTSKRNQFGVPKMSSTTVFATKTLRPFARSFVKLARCL